ncbi:YhcH/YjgK/YiaL family protein [Paenibacillus sp. LHD-117]|uniref:YhcH/YjgK/YiaL family protein n=1 Tax=Paenibacillus sp. LHD-117 TaxID=3071412 RepID=UPI0027E1F699|nr:YhcH/YjgK/YiaL family protein [Paenibacillus sp. LHD-117]MDQ6423495.1 YhcH/YjgK/YiaL family protein [Paenibacillus sp. LHD-117]
MIAGSLTKWPDKRQFAHPVLRTAVGYLAETDFLKLDDGKYPIQGDEIYAMVMTISSKPASEQPAEKHETYVDIHLLLEGTEVIGWQFDDGSEMPSQSYDSEKDYALYAELKNESFLLLQPGMFVVLFPEDLHRPGLTESAASGIRKVVVKIRHALLEL